MGVVVPHRELSAEALKLVVESFVGREGTDYGEAEVPLADKVSQVITQLDSGALKLLFDEESQSVNIVTADEYRRYEV